MPEDITYAVVGTLTKSRKDDGILYFEASKATGPEPDGDGQRVDMDWARGAMREWFATGANLREQHDTHRAIGKALTLEERTDGLYISGKVVDPIAIRKVEEGVLTDLSIGVRHGRLHFGDKALAPNGVLCGGRVVEVSLADRGSHPETKLILGKAAEPDGNYIPVEELTMPEEINKAERVEHSHSHAHGDGHHRHDHNHGPDVKEHRSLDSGVPHNHSHDDSAPPLVGSDGEKAAQPDEEQEFDLLEDGEPEVGKAVLSTGQRKKLSRSQFAIPEKAPGSGSYPIPDETHARNALQRVSQFGSAEEKRRVRAAVRRKFPGIEQEGEDDDEKALRAEWAAIQKAAKPKGWDPDDDGDDDSTAAGDTDHDYWNEDGTPTAKGRAAGFGSGEKVAAPDLVKTLSDNPDAIADLRKALGIEAMESAWQEKAQSLDARVEKIASMPLPGPARARPQTAGEIAGKADMLRLEARQYAATAEQWERAGDEAMAQSYRGLATRTNEQLEKLLSPDK